MSDNELIAEFMGFERQYIHTFKNGVFYAHPDFGGVFGPTAQELKYQTSWDWLMPVVEKIESIWDDFHGYFGVHISSNSCTIQGTKLRTDTENFHPAYFADYYHNSKIEAAYIAIVSFIKWYNNGNPSKVQIS